MFRQLIKGYLRNRWLFRCWKSTLVRVINLLQRPTAGTVIINKENILTFSKKELRQQRKRLE